MNNGIEIRESLSTDRKAIEGLYPAAFPDEDLIPLVNALLREEDNVFSFVAINSGTLAGHVVFTMCSIEGRGETVGLLGPVAVSPHMQKQGIGSALIQDGLNRLRSAGAAQVYVLGDPAYYSRFGFGPECNVMPPYPLPKEWQTAWQSINLHDVKSDLKGVLSVPEPWRQPALWAP